MTAALPSPVTTPLQAPHDDPSCSMSFSYVVQNPGDAAPIARGRFHHSGTVNLRGANIVPFCTTVTTPGLTKIARQIRKLIIDFEDVHPTDDELELLCMTLLLCNSCTDLTLLGLPSAEFDGWMLRDTSFSLDRFVTNLSLTSKDVLDFLRRQPNITELSTTSPPPHMVQPKSTYQHLPFPNEITPNLRSLDCPAPTCASTLTASTH